MCFKVDNIQGDFRVWESLQTVPDPFIGSFEYVKRFQNLKFTIRRTRAIQSKILSSFEGLVATYISLNKLEQTVSWNIITEMGR